MISVFMIAAQFYGHPFFAQAGIPILRDSISSARFKFIFSQDLCTHLEEGESCMQ